MTETKTRTRMKVLAALVVFMFSALTTRLWFLQVLASQQFSAMAEQNQIRLVPIIPLRGQILDRNGNVLVGNRPSTVVLIDRSQVGDQSDEVLYRLSRLLKVPVQDMVKRLDSVKYLPYQPVPVAEDVSKDAVFFISEHPNLFRGVSYRVEAVRDYPDGDLAAHMLGYLGPISAEQTKEKKFADYQQSELVGQGGLESTYEQWLHGTDGTQGIQVNAQGRVLDEDIGSSPPKPGDNVILSVDERIQQLAENSLKLGIQLARNTADRTSGQYLRATGGAAIVMDPRNGRVLAMASNPTFDPSIFLGGLSHKEAATLDLNGGAPLHNSPFLDRAIQGLYPAGSTFKPFVASAALKERMATEGGHYPCPAYYTAPIDPTQHHFNNWDPRDIGSITLPEALGYSCDTVFYRFGYEMWVRYVRTGKQHEIFQQDLERMGFGQPTHIDLPGEQSGLVPTAAYLERKYKSNPAVYGKYYGWLPGDSINLSIGQGSLTVTPIQLAMAYSAIANGGTLYEPRLGLRVQDQNGRVVDTIAPKALGRLPISRQRVNFLRRALTGVTTYGTASTAFAGFPLDQIPIAAKTGTADIPPKQPVSWFAAMAPANNPRYVVVTMVEQGGHGSTTAAPIARRIFEGLYNLGTTNRLTAGSVVD